MIPAPGDTGKPGWQELAGLLSRARRDDLDTLARLEGEHAWFREQVCLAVLPAVVVLVLLFRLSGDFPVFFIASTLVLYMGYPLLFLIPPEVSSLRHGLSLVPRVARPGKSGFKAKNVPMLVQILWNVFFINSRALAPPFIPLFLIDLAFLVAGGPGSSFARKDFFLIALQCSAIVVYYAGIWVTKPYSHGFEKTVRSFTSGRGRGGLYLWSLLLLVGTIATLMALLTTVAIFMPGMTVATVVGGGTFYGIGTTAEFVVTLAALFFIIRVCHGRTSLAVARDHLDARADDLREARERLVARIPGQPEAGALKEGTRAYLESRIYRTVRRSITGYLPVYLIQPDIAALLDRTVLEGMDGHTRIAG